VCIALALGFHYLQTHLAEILASLTNRAVPTLRITVQNAELAGRDRLVLEGVSVTARSGGAELLRLGKAVINFSMPGLRNRHIDSIVLERPVVLLDDAALNLVAPSEKSGAASKSWTLGAFVIRDGSARVEVARWPVAQFKVSGEQRDGLQSLELHHVEVACRDGAATPLARIESVAARFALGQLHSGRLKELIVRGPWLHLTPAAARFFPAQDGGSEQGAPSDFHIDRLLFENGEFEATGFGPDVPDTAFKFAIDASDVGVGASAEKVHHLQLWELAFCPPAARARPFLTIDSAQINVTPVGLLKHREISDVIITGLNFRAGVDFRSMFSNQQPSQAAPATAKEKLGPWMIRNIAIYNGRVSVADLGEEVPNMEFDLNTRLADVPLSADSRFASDEIQKLEFADVVLHSPLDPFVPVMNFKTVFVNFSLAQIMRREITSLVLLNPTIFVGPDLFWYVDALKKRQASGAAAAPVAPNEQGWKLKRFEAAYGQLVIANEGQARVPLPLSFATQVDNIEFSDVSDLQLKLNLLIPTADYSYPSYQLEFKQLGGEIKFGLPPETLANNLVQTLNAAAVQWKQFTGEKLFCSVTYDQKGIYGQFGGAGYGGYLNGAFSFFLQAESPWQGWLSGSRMDLGRLTDLMAPENFRMTGPADFNMTVKARSKQIDQVAGNFRTRRAGQLRIGKIDELIARIPPEWSALKQGATRIGLETLRDFDYESANGEFSFAGKSGTFSLRLRGPNGSRNFDVVVH
jgi:hypothetical protein